MIETAQAETVETGIFRGYMPSFYEEDDTPAVCLNPNDWIARIDDGFVLAPPLGRDHDFSEKRLIHRLRDGEIVEFEALTDFGSALLTVEDDLTWSVDRAMPAGATAVTCASPDVLASSVRDLIAAMREDDILYQGVAKLYYFTWTVGHRFTFRDGVFVEARE